ncbi:MAG: aldo/keto reductase [Thermoguttaceae bacterium]
MRTRVLGQSNIEASVVGLGTWAMGGWMWGGTSEAESIAAIHAAIDEGINLLDTAPIYGFGLSESIVGKAMRGRRDKVVLATKCSMICDPNVGQFKFTSNTSGPDPNGLITIHIHLGPDSIRRELDASLKRLQTDHIDLYQTHWQDATTPVEDAMGALMELKQAGKIRAIGVCNAAIDQMQQYAAAGQLDSDQERYSMLDRALEDEQLPYCRENNVAVLAYSPLVLGLLTGKIGPDREFPVGDQRRMNMRFTKKNLQNVADLLDTFKPIAERHGITLAQLVIAWTVHQPGLTHALCGARNIEQAKENAAAGDVELTDDELQSIDRAIRDSKVR